MNTSPSLRTPFWRSALAGVIIGSTLYIFPFLLPAIALVLLLGLAVRVLFGGRRRFGRYRAHPAFAYWNRLSPADREAFMREHGHAARSCGRTRFHAHGTAHDIPNA